MPEKKSTDYDIVEFSTAKQLEKWYAKYHDKVDGIWLRMYKKDSRVKSVTRAEALDIALCFGWIDGLARRENDLSYIQKYTPRRKRSIWSKINCDHIERLAKEGRMKPAGLAQVEAAKADGRWDNAYDSSRTIVEPEDFLKAIKRKKGAFAFYKTLSSQNRYAILVRIQIAKRANTRQRRIEKYVEMCANSEKLY
ncbi:MAG: YdeI/OmpD-associated family protein [Calditrichaeota bacterium]|nr:YdeI/OmpD-associated family protein [Calditrichota bacterium]MCB9369596.1 YdeI/OmpD-associated family protein [Calditrichota bacterium]